MRKNIFKNFPEKLLSLLLSVALYLYVFSEQNPHTEQDFLIKVEARNVPSNLILTSVNPTEVRVRIGGLKYVVSSIHSGQIKAYVDLSGITKGDHSMKVLVSVPKEVSIKSIRPENIEISLDEIISSKMKVEVSKIGTPSENYSISQVQISPPLVEIKGPSFNVNSVKKTIIYVNVSDITSSIEGEYEVYPLDEQNARVKKVTISPNKVYAGIKVSPLILKEVKVEVQTVGKVSHPYRIKEIIVIPDKVFVKIPDDKTALLEKVITEPINLSNITGQETKEISIIKTPDIFSISREKVRVEIYLEKIEEEK